MMFPATADGPEMRISIVQGNRPCPGGRCPNERLIIFENHLELSRTIPAGSVDLVVWPESSTGFSTDPITRPEYAEMIGAEARRIGAPFIVGGDRPVGDDQFINANLVFDETGHQINVAWNSLEVGRYREAIDACQYIIAQQGDAPAYAYFPAACAWAALGDRDQALQYLNAALDKGWDSLCETASRKELENLHETPQWQDVLERVQHNRQRSSEQT